MAAGRYNFTVEQGATFELSIQYKDSLGVPVDLTGYSGRMQLRPSVDSSDIYIRLSSSLEPDRTGIRFTGQSGSEPLASGSIYIYISAVSSSLLTFDDAVYDLELASGSFVTRLLQGGVHLSKEVTR